MDLNEAIKELHKQGFICEANTDALTRKLRNFIHNYRLTKYKITVQMLQQWVEETMQDKIKERPCLSILDNLYYQTKNPIFDPQKDNPNNVDMFYDWENIIDDYYDEWFKDQ